MDHATIGELTVVTVYQRTCAADFFERTQSVYRMVASFIQKRFESLELKMSFMSCVSTKHALGLDNARQRFLLVSSDKTTAAHQVG